MRIRELRLIRYGKFTDRTLALPQGERDIHFIVGPNEAGKSTVRTAIGDWLFGIPMRTPLAFLHPMPELRVGGILEKTARDGSATQSLSFDRAKANRNTLRTPDDGNLPDSVLQPWLGSLQVQAFNRMFALDHSTLIEGGAGILSASDDIGRMLFQSAAGIEHLGEALQALQAEADALWAPRKSGSRAYYQALEAYETAHAAFKQATLRTRDWKTRHDALATTQAALDEARERDGALRQQLSQLERIRRVRPTLLALTAARTQRDALLAAGHVPLLAEDAGPMLTEARQAMSLIAADQQRLERERAQAQLELDATPIDHLLLSWTADIAELNERRLQFRSHRTDLLKRVEEVRLEWARVQELAGNLGWPVGSEDRVRERLPATPVRSRLGRLLKDRATLAQELRTARNTLAERQQHLVHTQQHLDTLSADTVPPGLEAAVEQALRLGDHDASMKAQQQAILVLEEQIESGLAALGVWRQAPDELKAMVVPDPRQVQGLIDAHRSDATEVQSVCEARELHAQDIERLELELQHLVRAFQPVSRDQVLEARRIRDDAWQGIKQAPQNVRDQAGVFEQHMSDADTLADARLDRAQHEAARQAKAERVEQHRLEQRNLDARLRVVQTRMETRLAEWRVLTRACSLPELPLDMALTWLAQRDRVLELVNARTQARLQLTERAAAAAHWQQSIGSMLGAKARHGATPELSECLRQARELMARANQAQGQRDTLTQQLRDERGSLVTLEGAVEAARAAWESWTESWQAAVLAAGYDVAVAADQVEAELDTMREIDRLLERIRSIRSERIDTMQADLDGLATSARQLAQRLAPELESLAADDIALGLKSRLEAASQAQASVLALQARLQGIQADRTTCDQRLQEVQARLSPLMSTAGTNDWGELERAIDRSDARRQIEGDIRSLESLLTQSADGLPEDVLRAEIASIGPDELIAQLDRLSVLSAEGVEQIARLSNSFGTLKAEFDAFDGTATAAIAEAKRQEAIAAMAEAAERYLKLHTASRVLKWSIEKFRETRQGPMLAKASALFSGLTLNSFSRLLVDTDEATPKLFGIRPDGDQVGVAGMSEGSRDQLYLALRLAALELQIDQGLNVPLIADDLFINFDDTRTEAGLKVLGELSRKMQVVFLTHHEHLVPLAQGVLGKGVNVVHL